MVSKTWARIDAYNLSQHLWHDILNFTRNDYWYNYNKIKGIQQRKFLHLLQQKRKIETDFWPDKEFRNSLITNLSGQNFDNEELDLIALGPKFAVPAKKVPVDDFVCSIETAFSKAPQDLKNKKENIIAVIGNIIRRQTSKPQEQLPRRYSVALTTLERKVRNEKLIIV